MGLWTNLLKQSANIDDSGNPWIGDTDFATVTAATSVIPGQTAWQHANTAGGGNNNFTRRQDVGTLTAGQETCGVIHEQGDTDRITWGVRDETVNDWVLRYRYVYATDTLVKEFEAVGTDHGAVRVSLGTGPNGTALVRAALTYTPDNPGNARRVQIFPARAGDTAILHWAGLFEASTFSPAMLVNGDTIQERRVIDLSDYKVSFRPRQTAEPLTHRRPRASGKMSTAVHSNAVRARTWSLETEIEDRATGEALQAELDAPGRIQVVHNPLIHPVTGVAVECEASNVRRLDGPQEDHVRLGFDLLEVRPL